MASCGSKQKKFLTLKQKVDVIKEVQLGRYPPEVAKSFGICKSEVYKILKSKQTISDSFQDCTVQKSSKIMTRKSKHAEIDQAVFQWFRFIRTLSGTRRPLPVTRSLIQARAMHEAKLRKIDNFKASDGWFGRWRWRYNIAGSVRLQGEAASVNLEESEAQMKVLRDSISSRGYSASNVFNMDETALFYKTTPNKTYLVPEGDKRQIGKGTKQMKAKDRLTTILCVNATGTCKITPVIIGSAKNPRCFSRYPPVHALPYFQQKSAWSDSVLHKRWWNEVFLPGIREWTKQPVALLLDGFSGHVDDCVDPLGQVTVFKFPPNITSIYQPLDQGIIAAFKSYYKRKLLEILVTTAPNFSQLQALASQLPAGCAGLAYGNSPHISDAIDLVWYAWDNINADTVAACWRRAKCLPQEIASAESIAAVDVEQSVQVEMERMISMLSSSDPGTAAMMHFNRLDVDMLHCWIHLEENAVIPVEDGDEEDGDDAIIEETLDPADKVELQTEMQALLYKLHNVGSKLKDSVVLDSCRELCKHVCRSEAMISTSRNPL